ncbi:hypothetical protein EON65_38845 [archaeon]|nr:MAG: hypothetical protein EON65_38845 [archaeon]
MPTADVIARKFFERNRVPIIRDVNGDIIWKGDPTALHRRAEKKAKSMADIKCAISSKTIDQTNHWYQNH